MRTQIFTASSLLLALLLFMTVACTDSSSVNRVLDMADSLSNVQPDSALHLLNSLSDSRTLTTGHRPQTTDHRPQTSDHRPQTSDYRPQTSPLSRSQRMRLELLRARCMNKAYIPVGVDGQTPTDSVLRDVVKFYDRHGTPNEQMEAHYLLGCAYRDMGEAPHAVDCYLDAIAKADTTATDCDYRVLGCVYAQMAKLYHQQLLFSYELKAHQQACHYDYLSGDTLYALYEKKMCANVCLLQNKADSAENILLDAISQYRQYGYIQEGLQTSILLMHLYANQPYRLPALKQLVEQYDTECDLFDDAHELPPNRRLFYYYKGKYFENCQQLDSAEHYYRKVYRPNIPYVTQNSMYKGLLSVFTKRHQADSIAKYSQLYCAVNDSSIAIKDQEQTALMAASYNYNRYQHEAFENAEEAHAANLRFVVLAVILLILSMGIVYYLRQNRKRREEQKARYHAAILERNKLQKEVESLNAKDFETVIALKEQEIAVLNQVIERQAAICQRVQARNRLSDFENSDIVQLFRSKRSFYKGQATPTQKEWKLLVSQFRKDMPSAYATMSNLSPLQLQVCILLLLGFEEGEVAYLHQSRPQVVSNAKARANQKLFLSSDSASLKGNLMGLIAS